MPNALTLPTPPKVAPLALTQDELQYLKDILMLEAETQAALEATQPFIDAKDAREASLAARTDIAKKYGMAGSDSVDLKTGAIKRAEPRPGGVGPTPGSRPAHVQA